MKDHFRQRAVLVLLSLVVVGFAAAQLLTPDKAYSTAERRKLKTMPALTAASVLSTSFMSDFETYTQDQFPLRDSLRTLKAAVQLDVFRRRDSGGLYRVQGHLSKLAYPMDEDSLAHACEVFQGIWDTYLDGTDCRAYLSVVPDKNAFLAAPNGYLALDYDGLREDMRGRLPQFSYIAVDDLLSPEDYYRTDPHWKQENITDVAQRLLEGMDAQSDAAFTPRTLTDEFYGVYAGQLPLPTAPDSISVLTHPDFAGCTVYDGEHDKTISVYDETRAAGRDPYEVYLSGPLSLVTIENPNGPTGRKLVIFRDSFASALAPLLIPAYEKITLLDVRYLSSQMVGQYVTFTDQDVLFLYSSLVLNSAAALR